MFVLVCMFVFMFSDMFFCGVVSMRFSVFSCLCVCDPSMIGGNEYALHNLFKDKFSVMALVQSKRFIQ